jgi:hypothetical protein
VRTSSVLAAVRGFSSCRAVSCAWSLASSLRPSGTTALALSAANAAPAAPPSVACLPSEGVAAFCGCSFSCESSTPSMTVRTSGGTPSIGSAAALRRTARRETFAKEGWPSRFMSMIRSTTTRRRTLAWWMRPLISASLVWPVLFVFRSTRTTSPSSLPLRGRRPAPPPPSASACPCKVCSRSSHGSGKVKAFPLAP